VDWIKTALTVPKLPLVSVSLVFEERIFMKKLCPVYAFFAALLS
jgi:hypothetical protein